MNPNDETRTPAPEPEAAVTVTRISDPAPHPTRTHAPAEQGWPAGRAGGVLVTGYEVAGELGRGGMGVVYKALQTGLNRVVALKMLLAGPFANPTLRARFLLEAESVAALEHPHVVRVFAFGESGGHPYLAMEYVPGGTLSGRVRQGGSLPAREAAELVAKLAAAVAHAHSRGVVHRDIKPANVLLAADGEPRLTDFGLAKVGRADTHLSVTGQVLGTPAYMAPEQAAGRVREVGTAADVYGLGAVLYDVLTGRPPFGGDTAAVTLQKVLTEEPERPRKLNPSIPHDLETICLKCLEKEPGKRYPTAQALADDLLRYARNEPIVARPAGAAERGYKWVKRNKVLAGATAAVALALLAGAAVSLNFGLEARRQTKEAITKKQEADDARSELQGALAKALCGPLGAEPEWWQPLNAHETEALWELAGQRATPVAGRFLDEITRTPLTCTQLRCRAAFALHAAVGLDPELRDRADERILARMTDPTAPAAQRVDLAFASARAAVGSRSRAAAVAEICGVLNAPAPRDGRRPDTLPAARALVALLRGGPNAQAEAECDRLARQIEDTPAAADRNSLGRKAAVLEAIAPHVSPERAARLGRHLGDLMAAADPDALTNLASGLVAVLPHMPPERAAEARDRAARLYDDLFAGRKAGEEPNDALPAVTLCLRPEQAADRLAAFLAAVTHADEVGKVALILSITVQHVSPERAAAVCDRAARRLGDVMATTTETKSLFVLAARVAMLARWLPPDRAAAERDRAARRLDATASPRSRVVLTAARALVRPDQNAEPVARQLADWSVEQHDALVVCELAAGLAAVATHLPPERATAECSRTAGRLDALLLSAQDSAALWQLAEARAALTPHLPAAPTARRLLDLAARAADPDVLRPVAGGVALAAIGMTEDDRRSEPGFAFSTGSFVPDSRFPLPLLQPPARQHPRPLPPQTLVELLKHPFCVGAARRAVLDALELAYQRSFKDQWEFVDYAQKQQPQLDLLTPPKRPERP